MQEELSLVFIVDKPNEIRSPLTKNICKFACMKSAQTGIMIFCFYTVLIQILIFHSCIESIIPICPRIHPTFLSDSIMFSFVVITDDNINALSLISADICLLDVNHPTEHGLPSKEGQLSFDQQPSAANSSSRRNEV